MGASVVMPIRCRALEDSPAADKLLETTVKLLPLGAKVGDFIFDVSYCGFQIADRRFC